MKASDHSNVQNTEAVRNKSTFIVKIEHCTHGTWQGKVTWAEEERTQRFRSALELVKLMNEAIASGAQVQLDQEKTS